MELRDGSSEEGKGKGNKKTKKKKKQGRRKRVLGRLGPGLARKMDVP